MDTLAERMAAYEKEVVFSVMPPFPNKRMLLEITNICNHNCIFCGHHKMKRRQGVMDLDFARKILREAYDLGMREVGFYTVGEAFVCKDLPLYVRAAKEMGYTYAYITSNGALATPERVLPVLKAGIDSIKFSINAGTPESYAFIHGKDDFKAVKENLAFLYEHRKKEKLAYRIFVSSVLTCFTEQERELIQKEFSPICDEIAFLGVINISLIKPENCTLLQCKDLKTSEPNLCPSPFNSVIISWEGYLTACCTDFNNALALCDLNEVSLKEAWESPAFCNLREDLLQKRDVSHLCAKCMRQSIESVPSLNTALGTGISAQEILDDTMVRERIAAYQNLAKLS